MAKHLIGSAVIALVALPALADTLPNSAILVNKVLNRGDPYPGRPGDAIWSFEGFDAGLPGRDAAGRFVLTPTSEGGNSDLLVYDPQTRAVTPLVQTGAATAQGFLADQFWAPFCHNKGGQTLCAGVVLDAPSGNRAYALMVSNASGSVTQAIASPIAPVPGQPGSMFDARTFTNTGLSGLQAVLSAQGAAAFEAGFTTPGGDLRQGLYAWRPESGLVRVMDSTQGVPGHANASWTSFDPVSGDPDKIPFEQERIEITGGDEAVFRGKFTIGSTLYRGLFRGSATGGVTAIVDPARGDQVPGRAAGTTFFNVPGFAANPRGDVVFEGISTGSFARGIYRQKPGGIIEKLHDNTDAVPGAPAGGIQTLVLLQAMNNAGDVVIQSDFTTSTGQTVSQFLRKNDGSKSSVYSSESVPFAPAGTRGSDATSLLNDAGDVLTYATLDRYDAGHIYHLKVLYATLLDGSAQRILATGDTLAGMSVLDFAVLASASDGGYGDVFTSDRRFAAIVHLAGPDGLPLTGDDVTGIYDFQVVPSPAGVSIIVLAGGLVARRRRT